MLVFSEAFSLSGKLSPWKEADSFPIPGEERKAGENGIRTATGKEWGKERGNLEIT